MEILLQEPNNTWLHSKISGVISDANLYKVKLGVNNKLGPKEVEVDLDLIWFVVIYIDEPGDIKLQTVLELLKNTVLLQQFKNTLDNPAVKRIIAEFLLFNFTYLDALKKYIDFTKLNVPIDFISHALFIKRSDNKILTEDNKISLKIVSIVLDTGFVLPANSPFAAQGSVLNKVLLMDDAPEKYKIAIRLLGVGFKLFNPTPGTNTEVAVELIDHRSDPQCNQIIQQYINNFKSLTIPVAGGTGDKSNLVDYYYWVKEDMDTVNYLKETFGLQLSQTGV